MHKHLRAAFGLALLALIALAAGCTSADAESSDSGGMDVWGYVASADTAKLEVPETSSAGTALRVDSVLAPGPAWVVVHLEEDGMPGERVGLLRVDEGEAKDLEVPLEEVVGDRLIVALHADEGEAGEFDFDMMNKEMSPDRPYFVDRKELARVVTLAN